MKKIHYRNIGFPKTGTTWLWSKLIRHPDIDGKLGDTFKEFRAKNYLNYRKIYEKYSISINFDTHIFCNYFGNNYFANPSNIHNHTTHITCTLRNPYEVINSMFNMKLNSRKVPGASIDFNVKNIDINYYTNSYANFKKLFDDWGQSKIKIKYMFYDDLVLDPKKFIYDICDHLEISRHYDDYYTNRKSQDYIFKTNKKVNLTFDNDEIIKYINTGISVIEDRLDRDLSHWKKQ